MKIMKNITRLTILLLCFNSVFALAWTINGVNYRSVYYSTNSISSTVDSSSYIYADGGRTRAEVTKYAPRTECEKRTEPWKPNIPLGTAYGVSMTSVRTINYRDEVKMVTYFSSLNKTSNGYMHV